MIDEKILGKYPFLKSGVKLFGDLLVEDILSKPKFSEARRIAISSIERALGEDTRIFSNDYETRYLAYQISRLVLSYLHDPILTNRVANMFRDMFEREILEEKMDVIKEICDSLSIDSSIDGKFFKISMTDYVSSVKRLGEKYSLVYQRLKSGYVYFNAETDRERIAKVLREAYVNYFRYDIENLSPPESIYQHLKEDIERIKVLRDDRISSYSPGEFGELSPDSFPPCIKSILKAIERGENISHNARFSLVTFLYQIGMNREGIYKIFQNVPDFDTRMTDYQIRHITGESGKTVYSVPKCSTMEMYNLCMKNITKDPLCFKEWMTHPLIYYRIKKKSKVSPSPK